MERTRSAFAATLVLLAILLVPGLSILTPAEVQGATIFIYSDSRPGSYSNGEAALTEDFNQADEQIPPEWLPLDCVQNSGDIDTISALDSAYSVSNLAGIPHFMCVGNHEAETAEDMTDIRAKFSIYPDWNLTAGPTGTSETTYSYDVGDIHVVVINEYWDGADNDAYFWYGSGDGGYIPDPLFEWIKDDLRSSTSPYKIIVGHEPAYPVGRHVGDSLDADAQNRDKFFNLLKTERVIAYFTSHTHVYDLAEHDGIFQVNTGVCGAHVDPDPVPEWDNFATLGYAHCDDDNGFQIRVVREDPSFGWGSCVETTVTRSDMETQILVNTADGAGTVCRYFVDYTTYVEPNPDWSAYGPWWENAFDDVGAGWSNGEPGVGYDSTNPAGWGWINQSIDPDPTGEGDEQVYGVFLRIPFTVYDKNVYPYMKLGVDYDDALTIWLNGTEIYDSPTSPVISSSDYWDKASTGGHEANGDESLNPIYDTIDVSAYMSNLNEGDNFLVIGNWNREAGSSDLVAGVKLYLTKAVDLIPVGAVWRYSDTGTDLGTSWKEPLYDDSGWSSGSAELGYGDGDEETVIEYGADPDNKYPCYYFRHSFDISSASDYDNLMLRIVRDDGAVVYLNGVEVLRTNMPTGEISYATWASSDVVGANESTWYETEVDISNLVDGTNIIAVEVHQSRGDSSDVSFDFQLTAVAETPSITLLTPNDGAVLAELPPATFSWEADAAYRFKIEFSLTSSFPRGFPTFTIPRNFWMSDTSTDTIPEARWASCWEIVKRIEDRSGIVYWRVIGKAEPPAPIDISETRSFTIE